MMTKDHESVINDLLLEVEGEGGEGETLRPPIPIRSVGEIPDALVLCIVTTICEFCNTKWEHPNPHILGRYARNHRMITKWSATFENLPRERLSIIESTTACQNCFESVVLRTWNMEKVNG